MAPFRVAALPASFGARHFDWPAEAANDSAKDGPGGIVSSRMASTVVVATTSEISTGACTFPTVGRVTDCDAAPGLAVAAQSSAASCEDPSISLSKRRENQGTIDHDSPKTQASSKGDGALVSPMSSPCRTRCSSPFNGSDSDSDSEGCSMISGCLAEASESRRDLLSTFLHSSPNLLGKDGKNADSIFKARDEQQGELLGHGHTFESSLDRYSDSDDERGTTLQDVPFWAPEHAAKVDEFEREDYSLAGMDICDSWLDRRPRLETASPDILSVLEEMEEFDKIMQPRYKLDDLSGVFKPWVNSSSAPDTWGLCDELADAEEALQGRPELQGRDSSLPCAYHLGACGTVFSSAIRQSWHGARRTAPG
eukprot:TRINITY_DN47976_c0_g1_i2.p1 TRINITY_DN47976_c0_g1~~TRINITY_DN47976_c0_g1_i2.p1  ORF type:complete len:367 (+),score=46.52 TRINITY_DN47976_c0_g1_i2:50-1150(+)